jgi:hypothetical protein
VRRLWRAYRPTILCTALVTGVTVAVLLLER